jgi:hypothetical protein
MPTAIAFMISQVHGRTDRQRVERRRRELERFPASLNLFCLLGVP